MMIKINAISQKKCIIFFIWLIAMNKVKKILRNKRLEVTFYRNKIVRESDYKYELCCNCQDECHIEALFEQLCNVR